MNPVLNCSERFLSFSADKVTTETYNLQSFITNDAPVGAAIAGRPTLHVALFIISVKTQFLDQVRVKYTSQLTNGISSFLQKLLRYFNGTTILTFCITLLLSLSLFGIFSRKLLLHLIDAEFVIGSAL